MIKTPASGVRVAQFKANLSAYLRAVQRGHELTVYDRNTPIARVVPVPSEVATLRTRPARSDLRKLTLSSVPKGWEGTESLAALSTERRDR